MSAFDPKRTLANAYMPKLHVLLAVAFAAASIAGRVSFAAEDSAPSCPPLPDIKGFYKHAQFGIEKFGDRTVTSLWTYREIVPTRTSADEPIAFRTYYPSFRAPGDDSLPKSERLAIHVLAFPPTVAAGFRKRDADKLVTLKPMSGVDRERSGLREVAVENGSPVRFLYYPDAHVVDTPFACTARIDQHTLGSCTGRFLQPDGSYVTFTFSKEVLPCWKQLATGVREVLDLNLNTTRKK